MHKRNRDVSSFGPYHIELLIWLLFCLMVSASTVMAEPTLDCKHVSGVKGSGEYFFGNLCKSKHDPHGNKPYVLYPYTNPKGKRNSKHDAVQVTPNNTFQGRNISIE